MALRKRKKFFERGKNHGFSGTTEYRSWMSMITRCYNKEGSEYFRWGGKGVRVCKRWRCGENGKHPFLCFLEDMGFKPSLKYSIDRFPNANGHYEPDNCRWATKKEQAWSKIGKPRPDLAARNRKGKGRKLSKRHRRKIGLGVSKSEAWADWNQNKRKRRNKIQ